jgi:pimeloyl-ACP methyl ester carboxylesterase
MDERQSVDIGGASLDAEVAGHGPLTVVFENGLATALEAWDLVAPALAARARTVRYNRRRASSEKDMAPRTAAEMAIDLRRLLSALAISPPYVLVGHSWGGVVTRLFAHAHPSEVAGIVLVDATHEVVDSRAFAMLPVMYGLMGLAARFGGGRRWLLRQLCPPGASARYRALLEHRLSDRAQWAAAIHTARAEGAGIRPSLTMLRDCPSLPAVPIHVLTAGGVTGPNVKQIRKVHEAWKAMVDRAPLALYTNVPASGHQMPIEAADVVIDAVSGILDALDPVRLR